ncbi:MAG TPA: 3-oxoacyl-[acyl-carrier-protein] synthase III C-terminal domain-containing protein [Dongiaceae bacterium]|nr:3-oxoacyl-[acyl-carrier-protein] synthase III C-terminal domain-containing protein [Dongiaceae bacterium]
MPGSRFESIGVHLPEKEVSTAELIARMDITPMFDLEKLTGVSKRRWRAEDDDSQTLAVAAAKRCLAASQLDVSDLDVLIFTSITRFRDGLSFCAEPAMSLTLKQELGFRADALNFDITNACAGMMTGVQILDAMIRSGAVRNGMVLSGECITPISETAIKEIRDPIDAQFASLTVGDSGAAIIMEASSGEDGVEFIDLFTSSRFADLCFGMPSDRNAGVAMYTKAMEIHAEVIQRLPDTLGYYSDLMNLTATDFDAVIPHQTSKRAIRSALELCEVSFGKLPETCISLERFGNTSSTSHVVVLDDYWRQGRLKSGDRVLMLILASGIVMGIASIKLGQLGV